MEIVISSVIGGQIAAVEGLEKVVHALIIEMRMSFKKQFENKSFAGLDKVKINMYISGDVSEYCTTSEITKCLYFERKKQFISEFCIARSYWTSCSLSDVKGKFLLLIENLFVSLNMLIKHRLKCKGYDFDSEVFKEIVLKSLIELS